MRLDRDTPNVPAGPLNHTGLFFSSDGRQLHLVANDRQGLATWGELYAFEWADDRLPGDATMPLDRRIDLYKKQERSNRLAAAVRRDAAFAWLGAEAAKIAAHAAAAPSTHGETDPFANATVREWDISPGQ